MKIASESCRKQVSSRLMERFPSVNTALSLTSHFVALYFQVATKIRQTFCNKNNYVIYECNKCDTKLSIAKRAHANARK